jgi:hypothetical protein
MWVKHEGRLVLIGGLVQIFDKQVNTQFMSPAFKSHSARTPTARPYLIACHHITHTQTHTHTQTQILQ